MSTYARRSSQRHRRDDDAVVASSSRHAASSSRRRAASDSPAPESNDRENDDVEDFDPAASLLLLPCTMLTVTDGARREADKLGDADIQKKAAELVRYALACEYQRSLIRKDEIRAKVLPSGARAFSVVFNAAQKMLHSTFGFSMVEVRPKGADNAELAKQAEEVLRAAASSANGLRPRNQQRGDSAEPAGDGALGSNIWVLRSSLPASITRALVDDNQELTKAWAQANPSSSSGQASQRRRSTAREAKSALDWDSADHQAGEMGLLYIVLALILVSGRTITDATLHMYLRRLHLHPETPLPSGLRGTGPAFGSSSNASQSTQTQSRGRTTPGTLDGFLNAMVKQSYLERQRSDVGVDAMDAAVTQAQTQGRRRGRNSGGGRAGAGGADDDSVVWEWRWGSRSEAEVGEKRIAELISTLFLDPTALPDAAATADADEDEETQALDRDRRAKRRKQLLANIASVAGSQLVD